jgi:hypothetical protein
MKTFTAHERLAIVKSLQVRIRNGEKADAALNDMVSVLNSQDGLADPVPVEDRTNMNALFDLYEAETGQTLYAYEATVNGKPA